VAYGAAAMAGIPSQIGYGGLSKIHHGSAMTTI